MSEISERADKLITTYGDWSINCGDDNATAQDVRNREMAWQALEDYIAALEADKVAAEIKQREADLMVERLIEAAKDMVWWSNCCSQDNVKQSNKAWYALIAEWRNKQATE